MTVALRDWAEHRQADLLLYLGVFFLSVAALIFVNYRGSALSDVGRTALLGGYTVAFFVLGLGIGHWKRVREAGPVFVGLSAILMPLNFIMLYTQVLTDREVSAPAMTLIGSLASGGLYFWLHRQGYGRVYLGPGTGAMVVAWGSLGATFGMSLPWYGAWFMVPAAALNAFAERGAGRFQRWAWVASGVVGGPSVAWAAGAAVLEHGAAFDRLQLPVTVALVASLFSWSALSVRRFLPVALLPPLMAGFAASGAWTWGWTAREHPGWIGVWAMVGTLGYLAAAAYDPKRAAGWLRAAAGLGAAGVVVAQASAADDTVSTTFRTFLPLTYATALAAGLWAYAGWRRPVALGALPPLLAAGVASVLWVGGLWRPEWTGTAAVAAGLVTLQLAWVEPGRAMTWRLASATYAAGGLLVAFIAAAEPETFEWQLPLANGLVLVGAGWEGAYRRWAPAWLAVPATATAAIATSLWAVGVEPLHWGWVPLAVAIAVITTRSAWRGIRLLVTAGWPYTLVLAWLPVALTPYQLNEPFEAAAQLGLGALICLGVALLVPRVTHVPTDIGYRNPVAVAQLAGCGAAALLVGTTAYANMGLDIARVDAAWSFVGLAVAASMVSALTIRRWPAVQVPFLFQTVGAAAVASWAATGETGSLGLVLTAAAAAAAVPSARVKGWTAWRILMLGFGLCGTAAAHAQATTAGADAEWQLPLAYGLLFVALVWDAAVGRWDWTWLGVPASGTAGLVTVLWWQGAGYEHWTWPALGWAAAIVVSVRWWRKRRYLASAGWPYALILALTPLISIPIYLDVPSAGAVAFGIAAVVWLAAAFAAQGLFRRLAGVPDSPRARTFERQMLGRGAGWLALGAMVYLNRALELTGPEAGWTFAAAAWAAWIASSLMRRRYTDVPGVLGPIGASSLFAAVAAARTEPAQVALMLGVAAVLGAIAVNARDPFRWRLAFGITGAGAIVAGHLAALDSLPVWELPIAYGLVALAFGWDAAVHRWDHGWLAVPPIVGAGATSLLWSAESDPVHFAWPWLAVSVVLVASAPIWGRSTFLRSWGWLYALAAAGAPITVLSQLGVSPWVGCAEFAVAAGVWFRGALPMARQKGTQVGSELLEVGIAIIATTFVAIALGFANSAAGIERPDTGWTFIAAAVIAWLAASTARRFGGRPTIVAAVLAALGTTTIGLSQAGGEPGVAAAMVAVSGTGAAAAALGLRSWPMAMLPEAAVLAVLALVWADGDLSLYSLALAYSVAGAIAAAALIPVRHWAGTRQGVSIGALSTSPTILAGVVGVAAVVIRQGELQAGESVVETTQWLSFAAVVLVGGLLVTAEGVRIRSPRFGLVGTLTLLGSAEMGIGRLDPESLQAFTTPLGLYLIILSLLIRKSEPIFGPHMDLHEGLTVLGALTIALPGARDALASGSLGWSLLLLGEAFLMLFVGLVLTARWLVVGGVVTFVGVAGRFATSGQHQTPYWLTLGVVGMVLVTAGLVLLAAREWWERTRRRAASWWLRSVP